MWKQYRTTSCLGLHAYENMLEKSIIGSGLRRHTQNIPAILVRFKCCSIPLTDGVRWVGNYHAHLTADFTNHQTGKSLKLNSLQMSELQTVTADVLGMQRGVSSNKKHLAALQFKIQEETKNLEQLRKDVAALDVSKAFKQRLLGFLGMSAKDSLIEAQGNEIERLKVELKKVQAAKAAADKELKKWPVKVHNLEQEVEEAKRNRGLWYNETQKLRKEIDSLKQPSQEQNEGHHLKR